MPQLNAPLASSYRDPSGFMFEKEGVLYRQVNKIFKEHYDHFMSSGLYEKLVTAGKFIPHSETNLQSPDENSYKIIAPEKIAFISYPWEWSFDMLRDAALLTLELARKGLDHGMILKDATPFNIQWHQGKLVFIDSLSFEKYNEEEPWIAYRQFCENFLGPLLIMHYSKHHLQQIMLSYPEGIPLSIIKSLLPKRSRFSFHTYLHIHLHASVSSRQGHSSTKKIVFSKNKLLNLLDSLDTLTRKLKMPDRETDWTDYYDEVETRNDYLDQKKKLVARYVDGLVGIKTAADLGANEGAFSQILADKNISVIAADLDPYCINTLYKKAAAIKKIQPLVINLSNPSPAIGVNNEERESFTHRLRVDLVLALALIHHLTIGKNIPFDKTADMFSRFAKNLIIEFVPKNDEKLQLMLRHKKDIYDQYTENNFEKAYLNYFRIDQKEIIPGTDRMIYRMSRHES